MHHSNFGGSEETSEVELFPDSNQSRTQERGTEKIGIKEMRIRLAGADAVARRMAEAIRCSASSSGRRAN